MITQTETAPPVGSSALLGGHLRVHIDGNGAGALWTITPIRCFPVWEPPCWISLAKSVENLAYISLGAPTITARPIAC